MDCRNILYHVRSFVARRKRLALGILFLLLVVFIWVGSSNLMQLIFSDSFDNPFFTTYFATSLFSVYFVGFLVSPSWRRLEFTQEEMDEYKKNDRNIQDSTVVDSPLLNNEDPSSSIDETNPENNDLDVVQLSDEHILTNELESTQKKEEEETKKMPMKSVMLVALQFCFLWLCANYTFNFSLSKTSVSSSTIISTTSSFWTLIFCHLFKIERFQWKNLLAVLITCVYYFKCSNVSLVLTPLQQNFGCCDR